ncbi:hypothetical protein ACWIYZ_08675 [Ursidibacter arcticus]
MIGLMILTFFIFVILITIGLAYVVKRNKKNPSIALYMDYGFGTFSKKQYLYYDVDKNRILATLSMYRIIYEPWFFHKATYECEARDLYSELDKYIDENYTLSE